MYWLFKVIKPTDECENILYKLRWNKHSSSSDGSSTSTVAMEEYFIIPDIMEEVLDHL